MARDFAKKSGSGPRKKTPAKKKPPGTKANSAGTSWRWYGAGVVTGVFLSFLVYLGTLPAPTGGKTPGAGSHENSAASAETVPEPRFDFYRLLPEQSIEVEVDPVERDQPRAAAPAEYYMLQAGSFRQREDADRRRAELLLLGLEPRIEQAAGDNGRWFRVYIGPFDSRDKMSRARSLTAGQGIDTLLLKRGQP